MELDESGWVEARNGRFGWRNFLAAGREGERKWKKGTVGNIEARAAQWERWDWSFALILLTRSSWLLAAKRS